MKYLELKWPALFEHILQRRILSEIQQNTRATAGGL